MSVTVAIPEMGNDLFRKYMKSKYAKALERAGARVLWIPLDNLQKAVEEASVCDGLLLPGGADVNPTLYNEMPTKKCGEPNDIRDKAEPLMFEQFIKEKKPILAICRGFQLVNVLQNGNLYQDIKDIQKSKHMDFFSRAKYIHSVKINENTKLFDIYKSAEIKVNSMHHQAIKTVGENLIVSAVSDDGFVEAFELADHPFCVCVQWHPEHMSKNSPEQQALFNIFTEKCK